MSVVGKQPKYKIDGSSFLGATCELADLLMEARYPNMFKSDSKLYDAKHMCFTEEGQEIFEEVLADVENTLDVWGIIHEGAG